MKKLHINERVLGYLLMGFGVGIMLFTAVSMYRVFTGKTPPVQLFNLPAITLDLSAATPQVDTSTLPPELQEFFPQPPKETTNKPAEILSADIINFSSNIFAHIMLMGFIASIGFRLASLGAMLVRPVVVKLRGIEETLPPPRPTRLP
ncbi:MAG TPA: hypothetical protein VJL83_05565 [Patescibacteria group bacterium]|nr:hypothetical protein [Patescibacteria group bacterium]